MMSILEQKRLEALEKRIEKLEAELPRMRIETIEPAGDFPLAELVVIDAPPAVHEHEWTEHRLERPTLTLKRGSGV